MEKTRSLALGIDIGGTNTKLGIINDHGEISDFVSFPTLAFGNDPHPFISRLEANIHEVLKTNPAQLSGIGISAHGYLDEGSKGPIVCYSTPSLKGFDFISWGKKTFNLPVIVTNDLIAHSLAEYHYGSGKGSRRFLCMAVGTGFGVGVINYGKPLKLVGGTTGDAGRLILDPKGPQCNYFVHGSAEALVGVANIERLGKKYYQHFKPAHDIITSARNKSDKIAVQIMREIGSHLGHALALLSSIFLPEKVAITGGVAEAGEVLLSSCRERFEDLIGEYHRVISRESKNLYQGMEIVLGEFKGESGLLGSTIDFFQSNS